MIRPLLTLAVLVAGATIVIAQENPILARQKLMKENGEQTKIGAAMAKGEAPFDLAKAKHIFAVYEDVAAKMPNLFPPDSKTGNKTRAAPKIWEDTADFKKRFEKFAADSKAAEAAVTDLASFKKEFTAVTKDCGGCHKEYRVKRS
jgi:cytochrome c556